MKIPVLLFLTLIHVSAMGATTATLSPEELAWQKVVAAARQEGAVNLYTTSLAGETGAKVSKAFKDAYGITLELTTGRAPQMAEKVRLEQRSMSYVADAFDGAGASFASLKREGYLDSVAAVLPELRDKSKFLFPPILDPEAQVLAVMRIHYGLWFNINLVKPGQEPKSYLDLLDPRWKGKMLLVSPLYVSGVESQMVVLVKAKVVDEGYFVKLYNNAALGGTAGSREAMDKLARGEVAIGGWAAGTTAMKMFLAGAPIKPLDFKEGTLFRSIWYAAIKNAPHPNATKVFINWLLSREGQRVATQAFETDGVRNDIPSVMPFRLSGPQLPESYEAMLLAEERYKEQYLSKMLGIKR